MRLLRAALALAATISAVAAQGLLSEFNETASEPEATPHLRRRLAAPTVLPGMVAGGSYSSYLDTPSSGGGPRIATGVGFIRRGEAATYEVNVAAASVYSVSYSVAAIKSTPVSLNLVAGTSCYGRAVAALDVTGFSTGSWTKYEFRAATGGNIYLKKGKQTLTVCFQNEGFNFGGMKIAKSNGPGPGPAPTVKYPVANAQGCYSKAVWESTHGQIRLNGKAFHLKGANWFGFDTNVYVVHGIWGGSMGDILDPLVKQGINALRIPISLELALNPQTKANGCGYAFGSSTCAPSGLAWDTLGMLFDECAKRGILLLLDMHNLQPGNNLKNPLWYDTMYSEADFIKGWTNLVGRFKSKPGFLGIDLFNEPHGSSSWGVGKAATDWGLAAARIINAVAKAHPDYTGLFFVEGGWKNADTPYPAGAQYNHWWGGNLDGIYRHPITLSAPLQKRLVYSPHVYGPDVSMQPYFTADNFPSNMPTIWNNQLGFVEQVSGGRAAVIGEWGGSYMGKDKVVQDKLSEWMRLNCMSDQFWWAVNPDSGDTGGLLLDDWRTPNQAKFAVLKKIQPNPSSFPKPITTTQFCVSFGAFANAACNK